MPTTLTFAAWALILCPAAIWLTDAARARRSRQGTGEHDARWDRRTIRG